jgi:hypothetical protein
MGLQIGQIQETPGAPQRANFPLTSYGHIEQNVGAGLSATIFQNVGGVTAPGPDWIIGATNVIYGHIFMAGTGTGCLTIYLSLDGVAVWDMFRPIWIRGLQPMWFGPFRLPGFNARFVLSNDAGAARGFTGLIYERASG